MSFLPGGARKVAVLVALLAGCAGPESAPADAAAGTAADLASCREPRPEACTRLYRPVCGHRCESPPCEPARRRTYGNACDACSDAAVRAHHPGACEGAPPADPPALR